LISLREDKEIAPESMTYEKYLLLQKSPGAQIKEENKSTETIRESRVNNPTLSLDQIQKSIDQKLTENANTPQEGRKDSAITATSTDPANQEHKEMSDIHQAQKTEPSQPAIPSQKTAILSHQVKTGDTLYNISKRYGVSVSDIVEWNNIQNNSIRLGQTLTIGK
jgi:LysM repeat protein